MFNVVQKIQDKTLQYNKATCGRREPSYTLLMVFGHRRCIRGWCAKSDYFRMCNCSTNPQTFVHFSSADSGIWKDFKPKES